MSDRERQLAEKRAELAAKVEGALNWLMMQVVTHPEYAFGAPDWQRVLARKITITEWIELKWFGPKKLRNGTPAATNLAAYSSWAEGEHFENAEPSLEIVVRGTEFAYLIGDRRMQILYSHPGYPQQWARVFGGITLLSAQIEQLEMEPDEPDTPDTPDEPDTPPSDGPTPRPQPQPQPTPTEPPMTTVTERVNELDSLLREMAVGFARWVAEVFGRPE